MHTEQQFQFGVTIDNGEYATESARDFGNPPKNKKQKIIYSNSPQPFNQQNSNISVPNSQNYTLAHATHPKVCIATVFFKITAFFIYFFLSYMLSNVITFIFTTVFSALDFWVVKNISGRLLVGLKWWTQQDQKGNQIWKFQSVGERFQGNKVDSSFFWTSLVGGTLLWGLFLLINILQFDLFWVLQIGINFSLCASNLYGYYLCRGEHKKKIGNLKQSIKRAGLMKIAGAMM